MNEKKIRSISLASLLESSPLLPGDLHYDGCLLVDRDVIKDEAVMDLFRFPTRIDAFAVVFCSKGSITVTSDLNRYVIGERTMYIHFPGAILQVESERDAAVRTLLCEEEFVNRINIDVKLLSHLFFAVKEQPCLPLDEQEWEEITRSIEDLFREGNARREDAISAEIMRMLIRTTAYRVCRFIDRRIGERKDSDEKSSCSRNNSYFKAFMEELSRHYVRQRSVGFYAGQLHLTPKYFTTIIRKTTGKTAVEWIDDYVVLEAKNLLKYSTMSIQEVAYYLNFPNQSFFGKYFKNHTGLTPTAYRMSK